MKHKTYEDLKAWTDEHKVTLIAVSKTHPIEKIMPIYERGHRDFGENRVQELLEKVEKMPQDIRWHMIGSLQSNKVKSIVPFVHLIHSVDRLKILRYINKEAGKIDRKVDVLIQIHIADESSKHGFTFAEADELFKQDPTEKYPYVRVRGMMGMATFTDNEEQVAAEFGKLHTFFKQIQDAYPEKLADFDTLSMGMTGDYQLAVANGSTMIRVGRLIFGKRDYA